ncbi:MAG: YbjN domain-containing protein [Anaerolineae bacterium]
MSDQQIFNALVEFFEEDEWDFQWMEGASVLSMGFSGKNGKWQCFAQAREAQQQFVFYSVLPINVPPEKRQKVAELITRINYGMVIGNFEMDFDDGEVRYKTSVDVEGAELTPPMIRQMVYANIIITDRYLSAVMRTIYSDITPLEAIAEADERATMSVMDALATMFDQEEGDLHDEDEDDDFEDEDDMGFDDEDDGPTVNGSSPYSLN